MRPLIEVKDLWTNFDTEAGVVNAVNGVDLTMGQEKTLGVVGESGCGKSVTALSIMGLIRSPGKISAGEVLFHRNDTVVDLTKLDPMGPEMRSMRGNEMAMIFQEPMTALNPVYTIGNQIMESIMLHQKLGRKAARDRAIEMLQAVGIPAPERRVREYPHQLSGGMRQRAMIAMAISCNPSLLIADEPTTALDVTIQAQVLKLMNDLRTEFKAAIMFITHDLGVIAHMADDVVVMYAGEVVESGTVRDIFHRPVHPYTRALLKCDPARIRTKTRHLPTISGEIPDLVHLHNQCIFTERCGQNENSCRLAPPPLIEIEPGHFVSCHLVVEEVIS